MRQDGGECFGNRWLQEMTEDVLFYFFSSSRYADKKENSVVVASIFPFHKGRGWKEEEEDW